MMTAQPSYHMINGLEVTEVEFRAQYGGVLSIYPPKPKQTVTQYLLYKMPISKEDYQRCRDCFEIMHTLATYQKHPEAHQKFPLGEEDLKAIAWAKELTKQIEETLTRFYEGRREELDQLIKNIPPRHALVEVRHYA